MEGRDQHEAGTQGELDEKRWEGWEEKQGKWGCVQACESDVRGVWTDTDRPRRYLAS